MPVPWGLGCNFSLKLVLITARRPQFAGYFLEQPNKYIHGYARAQSYVKITLEVFFVMKECS
jgi:hypothetical protein